MRSRYDPIKRSAAFQKTNWRNSQKRMGEKGGEGKRRRKRRKRIAQERKVQFDLRERIRDWE